jgi:hypothetical protein
VIWSIADYGALERQTPIHYAVGFIPDLISTGCLLLGTAFFLLSALAHHDGFLAFLVAILFSVAG